MKCREREHEYQFLGLVQDEAKLAPNNLWMSRSGYDSVSPDSAIPLTALTTLRWTGVNVK
jgi:hypothetical protein